jgi:hypothetical protein
MPESFQQIPEFCRIYKESSLNPKYRGKVHLCCMVFQTCFFKELLLFSPEKVFSVPSPSIFSQAVFSFED